MIKIRKWLLTAVLVSLPVAHVDAADAIPPVSTLRDRIGGGNLVTHMTGAPSVQLYSALHGVGAKMGRMNSYGWRTVDRKPMPHNFDAAMLEAHRNGIRPILLFEYEGSYQFLQPPQPTGSYDDWFAAGQVFARRFRPNGEWARENGIKDWGAEVFTAINEPDVQATIPREAYRDALAGLADGVHSVDASLRVVPGGFATCNSHHDATLRGYGPVIGGLLQDGRLDGIDLHTYYHAQFYPLTKGREFSVQTCFERVKAAMGVTREINFYSTEFNISRDGAWFDENLTAKLFLTAFWDNAGVVRADGKTSATVLAFPWALGDTARIDGPGYAMAATEDPWSPDPRSRVLRMVLYLAGDMKFTALDRRAGTFTLEGAAGQLQVWQDVKGWTETWGPVWEVKLPPWAKTAELWAWDGKRRDLVVGDGRVVLTGLPADETYMLKIPRPKN